MHSVAALSVLALIATHAVAQSTSTNLFNIWPGIADSSTRELLGTSDGDILLEVRGASFHASAGGNGTDAFANIGDVNSFPPQAGGSGLGTLAGFYLRMQDQNGRTPDAFHFTIVAEDTVNFGPVISGDLFRSETLSTPPAGPVPVAWLARVDFSNFVDVLPTSDTFYFGAGVSANPSWPTDGLSVQLASFNGLGAPWLNNGDNPVDPNGPATITWLRDRTNGVAYPSATARTHDMGFYTPAPILHFGADVTPAGRTGPNPSYGYAGVHPDICGIGNQTRMLFYPAFAGRGGGGDGLSVRLRAKQAVGLTGVLLLGIQLNPGPLPYLFNPGFRGPFSLSPQLILPGGQTGPIAANGRVDLGLAGYDVLCAYPGNTLAAQMLVVTPQAIYLTNGCKTHF